MNKIHDAKSIKTVKKSKILAQKTIELGQASVIHGLGKIFKTESRLIRILWIFCFLSAVGTCSIALFSNIRKYIQYDVTSKIEIINELKSTFPTISICGINPLVTEEAQMLVLSKYKEIQANLSIENDPDFTENIKWANKLALFHAFYDKNFTDEERKKLSFPLEKILLDCNYNENNCSSQYFDSFYDINFGNCLKFNSGYNSTGDGIPLLVSKKSGTKNGLKLVFLFGKPENNYSSTYNAGLRVVVHNSSAGRPLLEGVDVELSTLTNIAIHRVFNYKSPYPYSSCFDLTNFDSYYYKVLTKNGVTYRQQDCFNLCLQNEIIKQCNCYDLNYPKLGNAKACLDKIDVICVIDITNDFIEGNLSEDCLKMCPLECESVNYELTLSSSNFPTYNAYFIYKKLANLSYETVRENALAVNIYYQELGYTKISESPNMQITDLLSQIGGTLGLFIGFSFLSLIELVELILELMFVSCRF